MAVVARLVFMGEIWTRFLLVGYERFHASDTAYYVIFNYI